MNTTRLGSCFMFLELVLTLSQYFTLGLHKVSIPFLGPRKTAGCKRVNQLKPQNPHQSMGQKKIQNRRNGQIARRESFRDMSTPSLSYPRATWASQSKHLIESMFNSFSMMLLTS